MKSTLLLLILFFGSNLYGQTDSIEKATINNKLLSKEIGKAAYSRICEEWFQQMSLMKYPDLPLDQNGQVHYIFLNEFKGFDKENLFNRTLEWLSINYGLVPANMYTNFKDGKIIFRNSLDLFIGNICFYTTIISIKDEKIKIELINISYQTYYEGSENSISFNINNVYPVILKKSFQWSSNLKLLKSTNDLFDTEIKNLWSYIISYENPYAF